ncbi:MAG TPA: TfoX/Sxy family protein [Longimicrobiales bacterium]|nr:TfoX/Sxy family protein [Longimicrobiales bacterium]
MPVSGEYREFVLEQLGRVVPVLSRSMFGGVGIYANGLFFALMADDTLYLKVDDTNRAEFERIGSGPFRPFGDNRVMQYYELPADILEDVEALAPWVERAIDVAARARRRQR